jgi:hypothetical protein
MQKAMPLPDSAFALTEGKPISNVLCRDVVPWNQATLVVRDIVGNKDLRAVDLRP